MLLNWPSCRNARDLGGLTVVAGGRIRSGALVRSDNHDRLTSHGVELVRAGGFSRILDLRWPWECEKYPSPFADDAEYRNVPLLAEDEEDATVVDTYRLLLDTSQQTIGVAVNALATAPPGGVVVHCHAGRDRTGLFIALALGTAGVATDQIAADYARSAGCAAQIMTATLGHLEDRYGGITGYLQWAGVHDRNLDAIRARLLDDAVRDGSTCPPMARR